MAAVVPLQDGTVGVRRFMDSVDDAGGVPADDLFIRYVFPPERESEIRDRRTARDRLAALSARAAAEAPELSQDVFPPIRERLATWEFTPVINAAAFLEEGLNAYLALRDRLPAIRTAAEQARLPYPVALEGASEDLGVLTLPDDSRQRHPCNRSLHRRETAGLCASQHLAAPRPHRGDEP